MRAFDDPYEELTTIAGRSADRAIKSLEEATTSFEQGRERDALKVVRPLYEKYPTALGVQELFGMSLYATGSYKKAKEILEKFTEKSGSYDQYPILMDCYRAEKNYTKVDKLWAELGAVSPSGAVVAEGRIVHSQSLAERGKIAEALKLLRKKVKPLARPKDYHLRLWYCLADLEERAGNIISARQWFDRVNRASPGFADVVYRIKQLN